jgi:hypothetical protein
MLSRNLRCMRVKKTLRKLWYFIWEDDSFWSWVVNIILAYVLIKFVVYPVMGLTLATTHPIVAVVSGSMDHGGGFDQWWETVPQCNGNSCPYTQEEFYSTYNISKSKFKEFRFDDGFRRGDIMVLRGSKPHELEIGDVLVFQSLRSDPIIHRIIKISNIDGKYIYQTKGDHNGQSISQGGYLNEVYIQEDQLIGKAVFRFPYIGYIKIWFIDFVNNFVE